MNTYYILYNENDLNDFTFVLRQQYGNEFKPTYYSSLFPDEIYKLYINSDTNLMISKKSFKQVTEIEARTYAFECFKYNLETILELKLQKVEGYKKNILDSGVYYDGTLFQSRQKDREAVMGQVLLYTGMLLSGVTNLPDVQWIPYYNEPKVTFTYQQFMDFATKLGNYYSQITMKARTEKDAINALVVNNIALSNSEIMQLIIDYDYKKDWINNIL